MVPSTGTFASPANSNPPNQFNSQIFYGTIDGFLNSTGNLSPNNWDLSLFKNIPLASEQRQLQLRWEVYNVFNHTQFAGVNNAARFDVAGNQVNAQFGQVTSARTPRVMQMSLNFRF
jgi:hypothetical protein